MSPIRLRSTVLAAAVLCATTPWAAAQTTINLNTANGACVAVVGDSAGLTLDPTPGSTALNANQVSLTAAQTGACNPVGGSSATFDALVQTSGSATPGTPYVPGVGAPFYVLWSAGADATACTYGGNFTSGVSGWALGLRACNDSASCSAAHAVPVTPTASGNYAFSVTCTNASGYASAPQISVPQPATPAPTPNPIPLTAPSSAQSGVSFAVTWPQMANTNRCVGTGTLNGTPAAALGDWTTLTTVSTTGANSRNVTVPSSATSSALILTLTCWNADNSASAAGTTASIAVSPASAGSCPTTITTQYGTRTLQTTSAISYGAYPQQRPSVDLSQWDNIWGHNSVSDAGTPWPGVGGSSPVLRSFGRGNYVGAHFRTTSSTSVSGNFSNPTLAAGPNATMAISTVCGDFSDHLPTPGCLVTNVATADANLVRWKMTANNPSGSCNLQPNTDYYVNWMLHDATSDTECPAGSTTCNLSAVSYHN